MSASRSSGFGGAGVGQKFKPPLSKLVSDWVSSIEDKLTILVFNFFFGDIVVLLCSYLSFFIAFCPDKGKRSQAVSVFLYP